MTPEEHAKLDQTVATMGDMLPSLWWRLFTECKERGFTETQAMLIVLKYVEGGHPKQ